MTLKLARNTIGLFLLCFIACSPLAAEEAPDCATIDECLTILISYEMPPKPEPGANRFAGINSNDIDKAVSKLTTFGDAAVGPLVALLRHPHPHVGNRVAYALRTFQEIDPKYLPQLIAAYEAGQGWLPIAIAVTNTNEALTYLQNDFLRYPDEASNSQTFFALKRFGDRNRLFVLEQLENCKTSDNYIFCDGAIKLLNLLSFMPTEAIAILIEITQSDDAHDYARFLAREDLIKRKHPYGLDYLIKALETAFDTVPIDAETGAKLSSGDIPDDFETLYYDYDTYIEIRKIAEYDSAGKRAGPTVVKFLSRSDLPETRAEAAYVLGQIGYRRAAPKLLRLRPEFDDDWLLAYNTVESLGKLRSRSARPLLREIAHSYWYKPVRNNAQRSLNHLNGGEFQLEGVAGDTDGHDLFFVDLRYKGDIDAGNNWCGPAVRGLNYAQFMAPQFDWPKDGASNINLILPSESEVSEFGQNYPAIINKGPPDYIDALDSKMMGGPPNFVAAFDDDMIVGFNFGEFGGGVVRISTTGDVKPLRLGHAQAVFQLDKKLFVFTGLSHLGSAYGQLAIVERVDGEISVTRRIRLPSTPEIFVATSDQTLIAHTYIGDVAIRSDGILLDPGTIGDCEADSSFN